MPLAVQLEAPSVARVNERHEWEYGQRLHQAALQNLKKQAPSGAYNQPPRAQARVRQFSNAHREAEIGVENQKLIEKLEHIATGYTGFDPRAPPSRRDYRKLPGPFVVPRGERLSPSSPPKRVRSLNEPYRFKMQRVIQQDNEASVKRLLGVGTTFDRRNEARDFSRHQRTVQNLQRFVDRSTLQSRSLPRLRCAGVARPSSTCSALGLQGNGPWSAMLRVRQLSGEEVFQMRLEEFCRLADQKSSPVRFLKRQLQTVCGVPRFRQRLLLDDGAHLDEDMGIGSPMELQLVVLNFAVTKGRDADELVQAVYLDKVARVESILSRPQDPNKPSQGRTPLMAAVSTGSLHVVAVLLEANADPDATSSAGHSALQIACAEGHLEIVRLMLQAGAQEHKSSRSKVLPEAAVRGDVEMVRMLLEADAHVRSGNSDAFNALKLATEQGFTDVVQLLLEFRANVDSTDDRCNHFRTCLHKAASRGFVDVAKLLLKAKADKDRVDKEGNTALSLAAAEGKSEAAAVLLNAAAAIDKENHEGQTPLFRASLQSQEDMTGLLLRAGADSNRGDAVGDTPLIIAAKWGSTDIVRLLLAARANADGPNRARQTPLLVASMRDCRSITHLLLLANADTEKGDDDGHTPLILAAEAGHVQIAHLLLQFGANINKTNRAKQTPLFVASENGWLNMCRLLLDSSADQDKTDHRGRTPFAMASEEENQGVARMLQEDAWRKGSANPSEGKKRRRHSPPPRWPGVRREDHWAPLV